MNAALPTTPRIALIVLILGCLLPRSGRAENGVSYKFEHYREAGDRITVRTHGAFLEQSLGLKSRVRVHGLLDAIAGATPNGQPAPAGSDQVPLSRMHDRRKAWNAEFAHAFDPVTVTAAVGNSRESDYVSNGWSLNTVTDFNQKNTQLLVGLAGAEDKVKVFYAPGVPRQPKRTNDFIVGVTQLLDPQTSVTANLTWGRQRGFLSDPYKLVEKRTAVAPGVFLPMTYPENRPPEREKWIALLAVNRAFAAAAGAVEATYRWYHDDFGIDAHTLDAAWYQKVGERVILRPGFRWYEQSAASFYRYTLNGTPIEPAFGAPRTGGPFYSSDYRLSRMRTLTYGLKVVWNVTPALQLDVALERYEMRGRDGVTPRSAYPRARIWTVGGRWSW